MTPEASDHETDNSERREFLIRAAVLGSLYALAIGFAVAFAPSVGVIPQTPGSDPSLAATPNPR